MTQIKHIVDTLCSLAYSLNENADIHKFTVMENGKNYTIYKVNEWYITVKRDVEGYAYAVEIRLKVETKLSDLVS